MINGIQLKKLAPLLPHERANEISAALDSICPLYAINTADIFHEFIANLLHECAQFTRFTEGMDYQVVALLKKFGRHRISADDCYRYGRTAKQKANQVAIANCLYGGKWGLENLGNVLPNDGWDLRGGGGIQITGRRLYQQFTDYYNARFKTNFSIMQIATLVRTDVAMAIHSACWVFSISKKLIDEAIADDLLKIRKRINGGTFGMEEVKKYYNLAVAIIK